MYTENGVLVDIAEIESIITDADVFAAGFRLFPERLLIDSRHELAAAGDETLPMVAIVDPVQTLQERYFWLGQHRPKLGMPQNFMFFFWPHSVRFLEESGVWRRVTERIVASGFTGARETCDEALRDLYGRERAATVKAITGVGHETLWSAARV